MIQSYPGVALRLLELWTNAATSFNSNNYDSNNYNSGAGLRSTSTPNTSVCISDVIATVLQLCVSALTQAQPATSTLFAAALNTLDAVTQTFRKYLLPPQVGESKHDWVTCFSSSYIMYHTLCIMYPVINMFLSHSL